MVDAGAHTEVPVEWLEALAESDADIAAGRIVPSEAVHRGLREAAEQLEATLRAREVIKPR